MVEERGTSDVQLAQLEACLETRIRTQERHHTTLTESHSFMGAELEQVEARLMTVLQAHINQRLELPATATDLSQLEGRGGTDLSQPEGRFEAHLEALKANAQGIQSEAEGLAEGTARSFFDVHGAALADSLAERIDIFRKSVDDRFNILC